jgi:hypothetical protein
MAIHNWDYAPEALEVQVSELLLATADRSDELVDENVRLVLQELRQHLNMEVIFVSEIRNGQRMFQHVDTAPGKELIATGGGGPWKSRFASACSTAFCPVWSRMRPATRPLPSCLQLLFAWAPI